MIMSDENNVLCGANSYMQNYYFNPRFSALPLQVQQELKVLCVLFAEEVGGILTMEFLPDGTLTLNVTADEKDYLYDQIESELQIRKMQDEQAELFDSLEKYYRVMILGAAG